MPPTAAQLDVTRRFAVALDEEDYATALALIDEACVYTIRNETLHGPEAIVASYKGAGDAAAQEFDQITYGSEVAAGTDGWIVITFSDHIRQGDRQLDHVCEQWVRIGPRGTITRIEHHDLPGECERVEAFRKGR